MKLKFTFKLLKVIKLIVVIHFNLLNDSLFSQHTETDSSQLTVGAYLELYYTYDFQQTSENERPDYFYSYHRTNELNVNLGLISVEYTDHRLRSVLGIMVGTYAGKNMAHELPYLRNIHEARIGYQLHKSKPLWLDIGVLESHIGFESATGANHWNLSRSILADNTPYYSSGAQLSYETDNYFISLLALNGWQRISRVNDNTTIGLGHQFTYFFSDQFSVNSSSFVGNEFPNYERRMRYHHNLFAKYETDKWGLIGGFDIGTEQKAYLSDTYSVFSSAVIESTFQFNTKWSLGLRGEYFMDNDGVLISVINDPIFGATSTINYEPVLGFMMRLEGRYLHHSNSIYSLLDETIPNGYFVSVGVTFRPF